MTVFSVVTPCRNSARLIEATMRSVLEQRAVESGQVSLEYVVVDGASTDGTAEIARRVGGDRVVVLSEPDTSMYDAIAKGLGQVSGDVHCYLNAGDLYHPAAFDTVIDVMRDTESRWVIGAGFYLNEKQQVVGFRLPFRYSRKRIRNGLHGTLLPAVQQEAVFWKGELTRMLDLSQLATYRLAGDHYMWSEFARTDDLTIAATFLGGFTYHGDHLSADMTGYRKEMQRHAPQPTIGAKAMAHLERQVWRAPDRVKKLLNPHHLVRFDRATNRWH